MNDWVESMKAGDEVAIRYNYGRSHYLCKIERVTATQLVVDGRKWNKRSLTPVGNYDSWNKPYLVQSTQQIRDQIERNNLVGEIMNKRSFDNVSIEDLRAAWKLLNSRAHDADVLP
jgi:hypothetical protein